MLRALTEQPLPPLPAFLKHHSLKQQQQQQPPLRSCAQARVQAVLSALTELASRSAVSKERAQFVDLVGKEIDRIRDSLSTQVRAPIRIYWLRCACLCFVCAARLRGPARQGDRPHLGLAVYTGKAACSLAKTYPQMRMLVHCV